MLKFFSFSLLFLSSLSFWFVSADPALKKIVQTCTACHGAKGMSNNDLWPNLAGQKKGYLAKQIRDFKSGARKDPVMTTQAKLIPDNMINKVAAYFSNLK